MSASLILVMDISNLYGQAAGWRRNISTVLRQLSHNQTGSYASMQQQTSARGYSRLVNGSPIYYGWIVWCVATIGWIATSPGQAFSISLFVDSFIRDFGLDRTSISALFALGTLIGAVCLTWVGRCIDKYGNRKMAAIIAVLFALSL